MIFIGNQIIKRLLESYILLFGYKFANSIKYSCFCFVELYIKTVQNFNYINILVHLLYTYYFSVGPLPDYPQTTVDKVASVIELDFT